MLGFVLTTLFAHSLAQYQPPEKSYCQPGAEFCPSYCGTTHMIPDPPPGYNLSQVQIVIRHGARSPIPFVGGCFGTAAQPGAYWSCPVSTLEETTLEDQVTSVSDVSRLYRNVFLPNVELLPGNCSSAHLLEAGYLLQVGNGERLHSAYVGPGKLFESGELPTQEELFFQSSYDQRTQASGRAVLDNMFPNRTTGTRVLDNYLITDDADLLLGFQCPRFYQMYKAKGSIWTFEDDKCSREGDAIEAVRMELSNAVGQDLDLATVFDCTMCTVCDGQPRTKGMTDPFVSKLLAAGAERISCAYAQPDIYKRAGGLLLQQIGDKMQARMAGGPLKMALWSGHDLTLFPLLGCFGILEIRPDSWPFYAQLMSLELYNKGDDHFVRVVYNGTVMSLPACGQEMCPMDKFMAIVVDSIPTAEMCAKTATPPSPSPPPPGHTSHPDKDKVIGLSVGLAIAGVWALVATAVAVRRGAAKSSINEHLLTSS